MIVDCHPCQCGFCIPQLVMTAVDAEVEVEVPQKPVNTVEQPAFKRQTRTVVPPPVERALVLN